MRGLNKPGGSDCDVSRLLSHQPLAHLGPLSTFGRGDANGGPVHPVLRGPNPIPIPQRTTHDLLHRLAERGSITTRSVVDAYRSVDNVTPMDAMLVNSPRIGFVTAWEAALREYTRLELAVEDDRLAAIAGVAGAFAVQMRDRDVDR